MNSPHVEAALELLRGEPDGLTTREAVEQIDAGFTEVRNALVELHVTDQVAVRRPRTRDEVKRWVADE